MLSWKDCIQLINLLVQAYPGVDFFLHYVFIKWTYFVLILLFWSLTFLLFYIISFFRPFLSFAGFFLTIFLWIYFVFAFLPRSSALCLLHVAFVRDLLVISWSLHIDFDTLLSLFHSSFLHRTSRALVWTPAPNVTYGKSFQKKCEENVPWSSPLTGKKCRDFLTKTF